MHIFKSKKDCFNYIKKKFLKKGVKGIVIQGSTAKGKIKQFSDIDAVIFNDTKIKPYYEVCLINKKIVLISIYFYRAGKEIIAPKNGFVICGKFYENIEHPGNTDYTKRERIKRDNQMFIDCLFKYLRSGDENYLKLIDKYSRI